MFVHFLAHAVSWNQLNDCFGEDRPAAKGRKRTVAIQQFAARSTDGCGIRRSFVAIDPSERSRG